MVDAKFYSLWIPRRWPKLTGMRGRSDSRSRSNRGRTTNHGQGGRGESESTPNTIETVPATVMPLDSTVFTVKRVNLLIGENAMEHRTGDYYANGSRVDDVILRRGFPFTMQLLCSRDYIPNKDIVNFTFTVSGESLLHWQGSAVTTGNCQLLRWSLDRVIGDHLPMHRAIAAADLCPS